MIERRSARVRGVVQGVGFRPFVARLARDLSLAGHVNNAAGHVQIEVEGLPAKLERFAQRLSDELPGAARLDEVEWSELAATGESEFRIDASSEGPADLTIPPDLAVCDACLEEVGDPEARRYRYPFTNCTQCGPRFTISESSPYDRQRTSMAAFDMCDACAAEYEDEADRRYHAQPIACPACGPALSLCRSDGSVLGRGSDALRAAAESLRRGEIVALLGLGGYQLLVRADDDAAVRRLRERKHRPSKPFALLVADLEAAEGLAEVDADEVRALCHSSAPIVLLRRRGTVAASVAPGQHRLGIMLPASPLHGMLAKALGTPLVCTSGNLHEEPICIDPGDAHQRLGSIADVFLDHDRAVLRRADDSVVHVVGGRMRALRVARGLAPLQIPMRCDGTTVLALGGHLKHAAVLATGDRAVVWPHVGDLHGPRARDAMVESIADLEDFLGVHAAHVAMDRNPDYATTLWAQASGRETHPVQHHHAHIAAVLAESGRSEALGFSWDGAGYGDDGEVWGGEVLEVNASGARRVGHLFPFPLPGGDAAARDGRRALAGLLFAAGLGELDVESEVARHLPVAASRLAPRCTSMGRLFDAVAALAGVAATSSFEGEAAMRLEAIAAPGASPYRWTLEEGIIDWRPMLHDMLAERGDAGLVASRFHATLVDVIREVALRRRARTVALAGGCFQNALLLGQTLEALGRAGLEVLAPAKLPPGDGGLALGQVWIACRGRTPCA